jgi:hypothetical protein
MKNPNPSLAFEISFLAEPRSSGSGARTDFSQTVKGVDSIVAFRREMFVPLIGESLLPSNT